MGARVAPIPLLPHDGAPIAPVQVTDSSGWNATFGMHRADLVAMLADALPANGAYDIGAAVRAGRQYSLRVIANGVSVEADVSSQPTASIPSFGLMSFRRRGRVLDRSRTGSGAP